MKIIKYIIVLLLVLSFSKKNSISNITVTGIEYIKTIRNDSINTFWQGNYFLYRAKNISKFYLKNKITSIVDVENGDIEFKPKNSKTKILFKDYNKNELYSKDLIGFKFFTIKDSINIINWEIKSEQKEILGYTCTLAESSFRGREYKAWFTPDLTAGGPWKLDGLPGMILRADTVDGYFSFEAIKIRVSKQDSIDFKNPYISEKKMYSWSEFKQKYKQKALDMSKYNPNDDVFFVAPRIRSERYIEEDDKEYDIDKKIKKYLKNKSSNNN